MVLHARARASCSRCHKRKKKCDRTLPVCRNCHSARVRCSFQDDQGETASFPIEYVRQLEERLRALEGSSSNTGAQPVRCDAVDGRVTDGTPADCGLDNFQLGSSMNLGEHQADEEGELVAMAEDSIVVEAHDTTTSFHGQPHTSPARSTIPAGPPPSGPTFVEELRTLSLEAAAERHHLGSTSGLSFAKLTQTVLRRLTPDKADFVFINYQENTAGASLFDLDSPSDLFGESILQGLSESISVHPVLFGDLFLADVTESSDSVALDALSTWPPHGVDEAHIERLVKFYFAHSHTLYPILRKSDIMRTLRRIREEPQGLEEQPPLDLFRLWMVLAIGSTAYSSIALTDETEPRLYYSKALQYSEMALGADDMSALEVVMLQVSYSFFNQLGPNTWFLVGTAARLALGMGLHTTSTYNSLSTEAAERCKRVFFSIYMMDRVVSVALGRPFAIHDNDIDIEDFSPLDEHSDWEDVKPIQTLGQTPILAVPLHILALRRIASKISRQVYSVRKTADPINEENREKILSSLHQELLQWRRNMPFPLPEEGGNLVPHLTTTWYDFNYYTHLALIYRPSPLSPILDVRRIRILATAASMSIRQAYSMHQQGRLAYNWLNFLSLFTSTISLVYAVTAQPEDLATVIRETGVVEDLSLVLQLFDTMGTKFLAATKIRNMVQEIVKRYQCIILVPGPAPPETPQQQPQPQPPTLESASALVTR